LSVMDYDAAICPTPKIAVQKTGIGGGLPS